MPNQRLTAEFVQTAVNETKGVSRASRILTQSSETTPGSQARTPWEAVLDVLPFSGFVRSGLEIQREFREQGGAERLQQYLDENPHLLIN